MNLIIGIDPDTHKSGVAIYDKKSKSVLFYSMRFFDLYKFLMENKPNICQVKVEAGWINKKSNFHSEVPNKIKYTKSEVLKHSNIASKIGSKVGANHETGRKILEMCADIEVSFKIIKPLTKRWKGKDGKITHDELVKLLEPLKINIGNKSNQDQRDAILICLF